LAANSQSRLVTLINHEPQAGNTRATPNGWRPEGKCCCVFNLQSIILMHCNPKIQFKHCRQKSKLNFLNILSIGMIQNNNLMGKYKHTCRLLFMFEYAQKDEQKHAEEFGGLQLN
jgi:hypothetical protein